MIRILIEFSHPSGDGVRDYLVNIKNKPTGEVEHSFSQRQFYRAEALQVVLDLFKRENPSCYMTEISFRDVPDNVMEI